MNVSKLGIGICNAALKSYYSKNVFQRFIRYELSTSASLHEWKKVDEKEGHFTDVYVYNEEKAARDSRPSRVKFWPDPKLGVIGHQIDPAFRLAGNIGRDLNDEHIDDFFRRKYQFDVSEYRSKSRGKASHANFVSSLISVYSTPNNKERQISVLHTVADFLHLNQKYKEYAQTSAKSTTHHQNTAKNHENVSNLGLKNDSEMKVETKMGLIDKWHEDDQTHTLVTSCEMRGVPDLLKVEIQARLFPDRFELLRSAMSLIFIDISVKDEHCDNNTDRDSCLLKFREIAHEICARLRHMDHWADYLDPDTDAPFFTPTTSHPYMASSSTLMRKTNAPVPFQLSTHFDSWVLNSSEPQSKKGKSKKRKSSETLFTGDHIQWLTNLRWNVPKNADTVSLTSFEDGSGKRFLRGVIVTNVDVLDNDEIEGQKIISGERRDLLKVLCDMNLNV